MVGVCGRRSTERRHDLLELSKTFPDCPYSDRSIRDVSRSFLAYNNI